MRARRFRQVTSAKNIAFVLQALALAAINVVLLGWLLSAGPRNMQASYQYDGHAPQQTTIPFSTPKKSEYFNVSLGFSLGSIHASSFVIGPDDCIETLTVNGIVIPEARGRCHKQPGHIFSLPALAPGPNVVQLRIHDMVGEGGVIFRVSGQDPIILGIVVLLFLASSWLGFHLLRGGKFSK